MTEGSTRDDVSDLLEWHNAWSSAASPFSVFTTELRYELLPAAEFLCEARKLQRSR